MPIVIYLILNNGNFIFIDYVNLLIHEGGHGIFSFFGKFIYTLGGSFMQLAIPGMFVTYYLIRHQKVASQISFIWLGENLLNVSRYIADAGTMKLPLLGGNKVYHDWNFIFNQLNIFEYDKVIGGTVLIFGVTCLVAALFIPLLMKNTQKINIELNL